MEQSYVTLKGINLVMSNEDFRSARLYANKKSDDPHTKVGCLIRSPGGEKIIYTNRFPSLIRRSGKVDFSNKHIWMVHAEQAAIADFAKHGWDLKNCSMLVTHHPCSECAKLIISSGIIKLIAPPPSADPFALYNFQEAQIMIEESKIEYVKYRSVQPFNLI